MVKLVKLELKNFKSFKKAVIPFAEGFTTIAGPNGSGKSNILDGLLFVLGITSMKMLRADKIVDLVNNTAEDNIARASLYLKDKGKEFEISRIIDRQGKSVCRLNGKKCGLNEIASFLNELGIKPTGYNIVVQGDITRIIQMNPKERRNIIDEAAGIKEFDEKREEALKELSKVEGKIKEVRIVLNEREQFLQSLAEERKAAELYTSLGKELRQSKATLLSLEILELKNEKAKIEVKEASIASKLKELTSQRNEISEKILEITTKIEELNNALIAAGEKSQQETGKSFEEKKAELKIIEEKLKTLKEQENKEKERIEEVKRLEKEIFRKKLVLENALKNACEKFSEAEKNLEELEAERVQEKLHEEIKRQSVFESELKSLKEALKELKKASAKCPVCESRLSEARRKELSENREKHIISLEKKIMELNEKTKELEGKNTRLQELMQEIHEIGSEKFKLETELKNLEEKIAELQKEGKILEKSIIECGEKIVLEEKKKNSALKEIEELEIELKKNSEKTKTLVEEKEFLKSKSLELSEKKQRLEEELKKQEQFLNQLALEKSKNDVRISDLQEEFKDFQGEALLENAQLNTLRQRIPQIERQISALGAVNMKALESFDNLQKEIEEVKEKANKLEEERIAVLDLIQKIEVKRLEVFFNCFNKVNENFNRIYFEFFEGKGNLRLSDEKNPFESGLIIEVTHKSDKALNIDLMSGGEKTLAALAFLFAIQFYEPSPFYVFDEADAALDDENSIKFAKMIKKISEESQFIAITHNETVIKEANQVIGVALNKQKSSVIGLKLKEAIANAR